MRECRFECESVDNAAARAVTATVARGPRPRFSRARVALLTTGGGSGMRGRLATVGTSAAGWLQRKELEVCAGAAAQQAKGRAAGAGRVCGRLRRRVGRGGEVVNACDAAAKRRDGSGDVATAAALLRMGRMGGRVGLLHWGAERCAPQGAPQQKGLCVRKVCTRVGRRHAGEKRAKWRCGAAEEPGRRGSSQGDG